MEITYLDLNTLKPCPLNVRKHGDTSGTDLMPSIRRKGVQQPLLVRPNCEGYEVVAGQRRLNACKALAEAGEAIDALPCIIMADDDDAAALEASIIENIERLPMDEIDQYEAFAALLENGRTVADIAAVFGVSERLVNQRLAIANLYSPILNAYRREEVNAGDIRLLTMASKRQQKAWWKLWKDEHQYPPTGRHLKQWLFGGAAIPTANALFDLAEYAGGVTADLFGEESFFADVDQFWRLQSKAIAEKREAYRADGWSEVQICEIGAYWANWQYVGTAKEDGGRVYITCTDDGEVTCHEGFLSAEEARKRARAAEEPADTPKPVRSELTQALQNYLTLHRHNAVRLELLSQPAIALRLAVAHMIAGSTLWRVQPEPQRAKSNAIEQSVADSPTQKSFMAEADEVRALLGMEDGDTVVKQGCWDGRVLSEVFERLCAMEDDAVMRIVTYVMAETLAAEEAVINKLGETLNVDMRQHWQPDDTFFDLLRHKPALNAMVAELAGDDVAKANLAATGKVQKGILRDCLNGNRKAKVTDWLPGYLAFPQRLHLEGETAV
ncbi:ParB/RepB/Spo0J family partition protein [Oricola sp.]|uniref:ParB/RepB/Spo0J family partition protein n=1 Tax=Oricola sp. TaxID=1979950 RepID=UPI0025D70C23|nr:ParB/RepB/Spo0J family partition protein [Oricola sp.]MCI5076859.1 ParB/RepB/Spo0J family partition protein [Oricola sp.]